MKYRKKPVVVRFGIYSGLDRLQAGVADWARRKPFELICIVWRVVFYLFKRGSGLSLTRYIVDC